ncbi:MAG TPA: carboxypeptidase regulatory-like domain-containing protein [Candidatus Acidoferrales bacterium]|jgi:hypothetical protein|nr:carboxypeptidase regulatory-like domain-containing protein [Candidatus Acidoferrales bacterium]
MPAKVKAWLVAGLCALLLTLGCAFRAVAQQVGAAPANQAAAAKTAAASPPQARQQITAGTLRGRVTDPSGASIPGITLTLSGTSNVPAFSQTAQTGRDGTYEMKGLPPGAYALKVGAKGFQPFSSGAITISAGQIQTLDLRLTIAADQQKVEVVADAGSQLSVSPENNAGAIILSGKDLEQFSDDPDQLTTDLTALAGPAMGSDGTQMYIDGFTAGQLPPKSSIREVRINQNPFSAEFDRLGYGRIEILTKPGTEQSHGEFLVIGNDSAFNTRSPFLGASEIPGYYTVQFNGDLSGPLSKKASYFLDAQRRTIDDFEVINAELQPGVPFTQAVANPRNRTNVGGRVDYQASTNNTLTVRFQYFRDTATNDGVGPYSLASRGYNLLNTEETFQIGNTHTFGSKVVNETRFQYIHVADNQTPQNGAPAIVVPYEFSSGGNGSGKVLDTQDHYEFQNYTSVAFGNHFLKFGARLRDFSEDNSSTAGYNGTFTFSSLASYYANSPVQFALTTGNPFASSNLFDGGLFVQDDWRWRPNVTISGGLRFETQTDIPDHADFAPRLGLAWGMGQGKAQAPQMVLRAGWGIFYSRFTDDLILQAVRQNGVTQQEYIVTNPTFYPNIPPVSVLQASQSGVPTMYELAPNLRTPYTMQTSVSLERQLSRAIRMTVSYVNARGVHQLLTNNVNAPFPGTYVIGDPLSGVRPNGVLENIYQYQSEGVYKQNRLMASFSVRAGPALSLYGYYSLSYAHADSFGAGSFPTDPYNLAVDYGRASFDVRHRVYVGGNMMMPWGLRLNPLVMANSGYPFNVTTPFDINGDSILNDRPALVSTATCAGLQTVGVNILCTPLGTFNELPAPGQTSIPVDAYEGPAWVVFNLKVSRTFGLGARKEMAGDPATGAAPGSNDGAPSSSPPSARHGRGFFGGGPSAWAAPVDQRYTLTLSVNARNLFNTVNVASPAGNLGSRKFDTSNSLTWGPFGNGEAVRMIQLQAQFSF